MTGRSLPGVQTAKAVVATQNRDEVERSRMSEAQVDQLLVERVQKGDKRAFDLLINKYQHRIISLVSRYVSDHAEAQDVAQEAFIKAYRALGQVSWRQRFLHLALSNCHQYRKKLPGGAKTAATGFRYRCG